MATCAIVGADSNCLSFNFLEHMAAGFQLAISVRYTGLIQVCPVSVDDPYGCETELQERGCSDVSVAWKEKIN